jgi:hypothetical protein
MIIFRSIIFFLFSFSTLILTCGCEEKDKGFVARLREQKVPIERSWSGKIPIAKSDQLTAGRGPITSKEDWAKIWRAARGKEALPTVDFEKELVLMSVGRDPNEIIIVPTLDQKRDLQVSVMKTLLHHKNPTTCFYRFAVIKREGIKTIHGEPFGPANR